MSINSSFTYKMHDRVKLRIAMSVFLAAFAFFPLNIFKEKKEEKEWFPFYIPWNYCEGSKVDMSFLLDAPAGKHGFLTTGDDGHFYFEDGRRARFWGLNIHAGRACFPDREQARDIAKRLAQLGCNIVRMHFLDYESPDGLIDPRYNDSQHFAAFQMDRLDYFIYQLKQNGVYVCFDVLGLGARRFKAGDGVSQSDKIEKGAKGVSFFDERVIELSKKFASDFLTHVNPYTGNAYINEPAIAMVGMTNENTLFLKRSLKRLPAYYKRKIEDIYRNSGGEGKDWSHDKRFLFDLQDKYQKEMHAYLRSIGVKVPIGASNLPYDNVTLLADSRMDFTDIHVYWDLCDRLDRIHNRPLISQSYLNPETIVNTISMAKVSGKPLISTEWGSNWPNDWRAVDVLSTAAYAALNDWDALFLYAYNGGWGLSWDGLEQRLYYGTVIFNDPAKMGLFPLASLIFLRDDVRQGLNTYRAFYSMDKVFEIEDTYVDRARIAGLPYLSRFEKVFSGPGDDQSNELIYPIAGGLSGKKDTIESDTGEIIRDSDKGIFILKTDRIFSYSGFMGEKAGQEFDGIKFAAGSGFATLTIASLDGKNLSSSKRMLLAAIGRARNKDQNFTPHATKKRNDLERDVYILRAGSSPILVEAIESEVFIKKSGRDEILEVYPLDEKGLRKTALPVRREGERHCFKISGNTDTVYYEIVRR
ncbi:MAG: hypothetical protein KKC66_06895 [Candidatus Omnitrophica bacterium]|nr:hypothetical protein [Candidatus Omnitrophota bacterium]